ncbi:MAG: exopolyphosphatase [Thermodesulfobacteriota bacterium]
MKFASIDIGSNAVRLLFMEVFEFENENTIFKKDALYRIPLRLGEDVFTDNFISDEKVSRLLDTMIAFDHLIKVYKPLDFMACATSAMREASNRDLVLKKIRDEVGFNVEIIDGKQEADIIYSNHIAEKLDPGGNYLYIDVGGGSTELTLISKSKIVTSESFNLGTVRILKNKNLQSEWSGMKKWLQKNTSSYPSLMSIGSGGNINKIYTLSGEKPGKPLSYKKMLKIDQELRFYSYEERIKKFNLKSDRADVIVPASKIYISAMKWANIRKMFVPEIGLADGLIHLLYEKQKNGK